LPFAIEDDTSVAETHRLRHRYLDLRRPRMFRNLNLRHRVCMLVRSYLDGRGFLEVETPILTRSTPEGARDYLVPSRVNRGTFFALQQSPQLFKQLLMMAGFERYFQIVRCFRDEDLRADRQPEFTQIDLEMSFVNQAAVFDVVEGLLERVFGEAAGITIPRPLPVITYDQAMARYGSDRPDLRFGLEIRDLSAAFQGTGFRVFAEALERGTRIRGLAAPGAAAVLSRRELDQLVELATGAGARGLVWVRVGSDGWQSPAAKFFSEGERARLTAELGLGPDDLLLILAEPSPLGDQVLCQLRLHLGERLGLIAKGEYRFTWVTEFPLLMRDPEAGRYVAVNHPFTAPIDADLDRLEEAPLSIKSVAYDVVPSSWAVAASASTAATYRNGCFACWGWGRRKRRRASVFCSRPWGTGHRRTVELRSVSTASSCCSPAPTPYARSSRFRRHSEPSVCSPTRRRRWRPDSSAIWESRSSAADADSGSWTESRGRSPRGRPQPRPGVEPTATPASFSDRRGVSPRLRPHPDASRVRRTC
jgi:aspartyl-tRNA synthetase